MSIYYPHVIYYRTSRPSRSMLPSSPKTLSNDQKKVQVTRMGSSRFSSALGCVASPFVRLPFVSLSFLCMGSSRTRLRQHAKYPRFHLPSFSHFRWWEGLDHCSTRWIFVPPAGSLFHQLDHCSMSLILHSFPLFIFWWWWVRHQGYSHYYHEIWPRNSSAT